MAVNGRHIIATEVSAIAAMRIIPFITVEFDGCFIVIDNRDTIWFNRVSDKTLDFVDSVDQCDVMDYGLELAETVDAERDTALHY